MNRIKNSYFIIIILIVFFVSTICFTYAFFTNKSEHHGKLNIVAGTLDYKIESKELVNNKVTVGYNETKVIDIKLTSLNEINSKYEIYYNYITSLTDTEKGRINIGYTTTNKDSISGIIDANKLKNIRIYINNSNNKDIEIEFNVIGGLTNDNLVLSDGNKLVNNDTTVPDYDIRTEIIDGKTYAVIDTNDNQSGVKQVEYNRQIQTLPKNRDDYKIYLSYSGSLDDNEVIKYITKYKNVTSTTTINYADIIEENYDFFIELRIYGTASNYVEQAFKNGINVFSNGNDTSNFSIFAEKKSINTSESIGLTNVTKKVDNIFTKNVNVNFNTNDGYQFFVKFNDAVEVWYQGEYEENTYDIIGYYTQNGTRWIHNQSNYNSGYIRYFDLIADYLLKINTAEYEITESGDYTFKVTDYAGNIVEKTVHIDV